MKPKADRTADARPGPARVRLGQAVTVARGVSVLAYRGKDGTLVIEIEGADAHRGENATGPVLRVYLNDGVIFANPPYPIRSPRDPHS